MIVLTVIIGLVIIAALIAAAPPIVKYSLLGAAGFIGLLIFLNSYFDNMPPSDSGFEDRYKNGYPHPDDSFPGG